MERFGEWFRVLLTWIVIVPDLMVSYSLLRNPSYNLEIISLILNFIATTIIFYIYMDIYKSNNPIESSDSERSKSGTTQTSSNVGLYNLAFGSLIEDMGVWLGLFFLLYNIIPVSLYLHNVISKSL